MAGSWNSKHRGESFMDFLNTYNRYFPYDLREVAKTDFSKLWVSLSLAGRYESSEKKLPYKHILDGISEGCYSNFDEVLNEIIVADKLANKKVDSQKLIHDIDVIKTQTSFLHLEVD